MVRLLDRLTRRMVLKAGVASGAAVALGVRDGATSSAQAVTVAGHNAETVVASQNAAAAPSDLQNGRLVTLFVLWGIGTQIAPSDTPGAYSVVYRCEIVPVAHSTIHTFTEKMPTQGTTLDEIHRQVNARVRARAATKLRNLGYAVDPDLLAIITTSSTAWFDIPGDGGDE